MSENKEFIKAKDYAYRLLAYRQRSIKEIKDRLKKRRFSPKVISKTVEYLSQLNYLNDENFANFWIQTKMQLRPIGCALLRYQLRQKGVAVETLNKVLSKFTEQYNEYELVKQISASRIRRLRDLEPVKLKRRLYGYLKHRGFSQEAIVDVIEEIK